MLRVRDRARTGERVPMLGSASEVVALVTLRSPKWSYGTKPRRPALRCVRKRPTGVQADAGRGANDAIPGPRLDACDEISVEHIFGDHETKRASRRYHVVDPSCGVRPQPNIPNRRFAQEAKLELQTVSGRPR